MNHITMSELSNILDQCTGKNILISTTAGQFKFSSYGNVEHVDTYTDRVVVELDIASRIDLHEEDITSITYNEELSRNNTQSIIVELSSQTIKFEFEV